MITKAGRHHHRDLKQPISEVRAKRNLRARKREFILNQIGKTCVCSETSHGHSVPCGSRNVEFHHPNHDREYQQGTVSKSWSLIKSEIETKGILPFCQSCNAKDGVHYQNSTHT